MDRWDPAYARWRQRGVWDEVLCRLQEDADARGELDWLLHYVDGSSVRAHQHAAGARRKKWDPLTKRSAAAVAG